MLKIFTFMLFSLLPLRLIAESGDINNDGKLDKVIVEIVKYIMGIPFSDGFNEEKADVNNDGLVNIADIIKIIWAGNLEDTIINNEEDSAPRIKIIPLVPAYARTMVNTPIFRCSSIVSDQKYQFVGFYDEKCQMVIAKRSLDSEVWEYSNTGKTGNCEDAHNSISLGMDGNGYLHISYNQHSNTLNYLKGVEPYSFELCDIKYMVDSVEERKVTYPEFYKKQNGDLIFAYRSGYSGNGNLVLNEYDITNESWSRLQNNLVGGERKRNAYWQLYMDEKDNMYLSWVWRETKDVETNHDICYAKSSDGVNWCDSHGNIYSIPITMENAEIAWGVPQKSELINQTSMCADMNGNPYIATYWCEPGDSIPQYRVVWNTDLIWNMNKLYERKTPFSLTGSGVKRVPICRPKILVDKKNRGFCLFKDIERGEVVSLAYCSDIIKGNWKFIDLTDFSVESWEPSIDNERWKSDNILDIFVQKAYQGSDNNSVQVEPQMVYVIEVKW